MSGYVEVMIEGNCRALIKESTIAGVILSPGMSSRDMATVEKPMSIMLPSGSTLAGVYGISAERLLVYAEGTKMILRKTGRPMICAYLDHAEKFEADLMSCLPPGAVGDG